MSVTVIARQWSGAYRGYGAFHSQTCATNWANRVITSGILPAVHLRALVKCSRPQAPASFAAAAELEARP
jgi:hypothetical protein